MARPTDNPKTYRLDLRFPPDLVTKIDEWRRFQTDIPPRAEAIRRLVEMAIAQDDQIDHLNELVMTLRSLAVEFATKAGADQATIDIITSDTPGRASSNALLRPLGPVNTSDLHLRPEPDDHARLPITRPQISNTNLVRNFVLSTLPGALLLRLFMARTADGGNRVAIGMMVTLGHGVMLLDYCPLTTERPPREAEVRDIVESAIAARTRIEIATRPLPAETADLPEAKAMESINALPFVALTTFNQVLKLADATAALPRINNPH